MRKTAEALGGASAIVLLLALAGCSSDTTGTKSSAPSARSTASTSPSHTRTTTGWVALHDQAVGVRFSLPHHVDPQSKPGQDPSITAHLYRDEIDEIGLSVTTVKADVAIPATYPQTVYDQMASSLTQQGATHTHLSAVGRPTVAKGNALDATLTFTATDGSHNYWRMRTISAGHTMVQLQVLTFSDPGDTEGPHRVDAMFTQLADSIILD